MSKKPRMPRIDKNNISHQLLIAIIMSIVLVVLLFRCSRGNSTQNSSVASAESVESDAVAYNKEAETTPEMELEKERNTFIEVWAERIDAFNASYPLEGYGATFAAAAYDFGVDPRYSPAIARIESGSGMHCFHPCNAWGWGSSSWPDWGTAIYDHVLGLAEGYGYTLSYGNALKYNSSSPDEWYGLVRDCMTQIWPSSDL